MKFTVNLVEMNNLSNKYIKLTTPSGPSTSVLFFATSSVISNPGFRGHEEMSGVPPDILFAVSVY
jgi:hypothetical protein